MLDLFLILICLFLLSISIEELISTPKTIIFWLNPPPRNEKLPFLSNPIPYPEYPYLSMPAFLVKVAAPNKQFSNVRSLIIALSFLFVS